MSGTHPGVSALRGSRGWRLLLASCFLVLSLAAPRAQAATHALALTATPGLDGYVKPGEWLPITVLIENSGREVQGDLVAFLGPRPDSEITRRPIRLATGARQRHLLLVHVGRTARTVPVRFRNAAADVNVRDVEASDRVVLAVSDDRSALSFVQGVPAGPSRPSQYGGNPYQPQAHVAHTDAAGLFDVSLAYSSADIVALGNTPARALSVDQRKALREWVADGGTLVVSGGSDVARLRDPFWKDLLPVSHLEPRTLTSLSALGKRFHSPIPAGQVVVAQGRPIPGAHVWVAQDGVPLMAHRQVGNGSVLFFAFDYDQAPVRGWAGQTGLWKEVLAALSDPRIAGPSHAMARHSPHGPGLAYGLANSVVSNRSMDLPSARLIGFFFIAYLLCLVPLNYVVLRRLDRREYAWATTPAIALLFCVVAYAVTFSAKGGSVLLYRLDVVEALAKSEVAAGTAYVGLFSPARTTYALEAPGTVGLREAGDVQSPYYGGGPGRPQQKSGKPCVLTLGGDTRIEDLEMHMNAMRVFTCPVRQDLGGAVTSKLRYEASGIGGTITNDTRRRFEGGVLFFGQSVQRVGPVAPGERVDVDPSARWTPGQMPWQTGGRRRANTLAGVPPGQRIRDAALASIHQELQGSGTGGAPILVAWGEPAGVPIKVARKHAGETRATLYVFHLNSPTAQGGALSLPSGLIPGRVIKYGPNATLSPGGEVHIPSGSFVIKEFTLPGAGQQVAEVVIKCSGHWSGGSGRTAVSVFDARPQKWTILSGNGDLFRVPNPGQFVTEPRRALQVSVSVAGGYYRLTNLGVSARMR